MRQIARRRLGLGLFLSLLMAGLSTIPAWGVNSIVIVSDTVLAGAKDTVFVKLTNDQLFGAVVVPLVFRQITPGAFVRDTLRGDRNPLDRLTLRHDAVEDTALGSLNGIKIFTRYSVVDGNCLEGALPGGFKTPDSATFSGPWHSDSTAIMFSYGQLDPNDTNDKLLAPGTDTAGGSLRIIFTVTSTEGRFEIDSTCSNPANHVVFYTTDTTIGQHGYQTPVFTKGYVQIGLTYSSVYDLDAGTGGVPKDYTLGQNYPNPFNAGTVISFTTKVAGHVQLDVFNILGQKVTTLVDQSMDYGQHAADWDGKDATGRPVATGLYFYRLSTKDFTAVKKMVLIK